MFLLSGVSLGLNFVGLDRICERWIIAFFTLTAFEIRNQWSLESCDLNITFPKAIAFLCGHSGFKYLGLR